MSLCENYNKRINLKNIERVGEKNREGEREKTLEPGCIQKMQSNGKENA